MYHFLSKHCHLNSTVWHPPAIVRSLFHSILSKETGVAVLAEHSLPDSYFFQLYFIKFTIIYVLWSQCIHRRDGHTYIQRCDASGRVIWKMLILSCMDDQGLSVFYQWEDWAFTEFPTGSVASFSLRAETATFHSSRDLQVPASCPSQTTPENSWNP